MKKVLRRLIIVAFLAFAAFSLFSCEIVDPVDDTETRDYSSELADTWIRLERTNNGSTIKMILDADGGYTRIKVKPIGDTKILEAGTWFSSGNIIFFDFQDRNNVRGHHNTFLVVNETYLTINVDENWIRESELLGHNR